MNILTLNVGSSSVKYAYFNDKKLVEKKLYERIKTIEERKDCLKKIKKEYPHTDLLIHRIVHGKDITKTSFIDNELVNKLEEAKELAPLHVGPQLEIIKLSEKLFDCKHIAVFDTAFHSTIPKKARIYGLPHKYFDKGIKKYGFHGINHKFVTRKEKGKVISLHLGSGCSITAVKNGKSIETSMGFTPLEGLIMGTRSGSLDPSIVPFILMHEKADVKEVIKILNKESGLLGISEKSNDLRDLLNNKDEKSKLAISVFVYKIIKELGSYITLLGGVDTIIFTGGIGENSAYIRKEILKSLKYLGVKIDNKLNDKNNEVISTNNSSIVVKIKKADEEKEMVIEGLKLWENTNK